MKRFLFWLIILALLGGGGYAAVRHFWGAKAGGGPGMGGGTMTATVETRDFVSTILATGTVKPEVGAQVNVGARISGRVEELTARIGDPVKKNQVLARIEHEDLKAQVAQKEAQVAEIQVRILAARTRFDADHGRALALASQREVDLDAERSRLVVILARGDAARRADDVQLAALRAERAEEVAVAGKQIRGEQAARVLAAKDLGRMETLFGQGMLAEQSLDRASSDLETAAARVSLTRAQRRLAKTRLAQDVLVQEEVLETTLTTLETDIALQEDVIRKTEEAVALAATELRALEAGYAADVAILEASLPQLRAALQETGIKLSYATVRSPIDGVVGTITTQEGETVAAGLSAPTFVTVVDLTRLQVDAYVDEVDIGKVRAGMPATFTVDAFPSTVFKGKVEAIHPTAILQDNVVYYDVVLTITDDFVGRLRPEMTANVTIHADRRDGALSVPMRAVQRKAGVSVVQVEGDDGAAQREVRTGLDDGEFVEILEGLEAGETVVYKAPAPKKPESGEGSRRGH
ncbi:MAG: efflux RND transporter periplasmic adaptor subunit [Pseudomonadota bacterium]